MIKENLQEVERRICEACKRSGRDRSEVQLIAVSKTKPVSMIEEAYAEGIRRFGENKPQELRDKYEEMEKDIKWHMIGHLQRNKVKYVVGRGFCPTGRGDRPGSGEKRNCDAGSGGSKCCIRRE